MVDKFLADVIATIKKFGTLLADRRGWVVGVLLALLGVTGFFGIDAAVQAGINEAFGETYTAAEAVVVAVTALAVALVKLYIAIKPVVALVESWAVRPPSGTKEFRPNDPVG